MTIVNNGVAGIYWVGSLEQARGQGLGRAATAAATNAGFELGADIASLQARRWESRSTRRWATRRSSTTGSSCHPRPEAARATIEVWSGLSPTTRRHWKPGTASLFDRFVKFRRDRHRRARRRTGRLRSRPPARKPAIGSWTSVAASATPACESPSWSADRLGARRRRRSALHRGGGERGGAGRGSRRQLCRPRCPGDQVRGPLRLRLRALRDDVLRQSRRGDAQRP